ncbi:MAG: ATP synthase F1 subunit gamma [Bacteroidetes bacterium 4572_77]|nr:MAG: ATP synthase F1 subunit gamma [Bacteroidetes bacterium 4572_77]
MPSLKEVRTRIASVNSTQQITSAMKMVAASKLRRAQMAIVNMRPYAQKLQEILQNVTASLEDASDNAFGDQREVNKALIVTVTSNRGLCGAFNANVIKKARLLLETDLAFVHKKGKVDFITIGKKATDFFKKDGYNLVGSYDDFYNDLSFDNVSPLATELLKKFTDKEYDKIIIVYNQFKNAATQLVMAEQLLPVVSPEQKEEVKTKINFLFEPSQEEILTSLLPSILKTQFYKTLLDSFASEHGARMTAMQQATDNAQEMLRDLKLTYNKARQASITGEILEIVGGAEALKDS